ncbi:carbamate kinase [Actinoplanes subtropicus]|uniref:carbamate kinase n=1 Tax=Actinoplanes subtropicus TaxID=543632 RepID=UPI0004C3E83E|nr:carbamate kinase [Actinoplanes subtropicus]
MRIVIALGGNALLERGDKPDAAIQQRHIRRAAQSLAPLTAHHQLIVCHGNGPQVGLLARESSSDPELSRPYPLDVLGAQTQGMIGYWLVQELANAGVTRPVVALVNQTVVDACDPAFATPTKLIGAGYPREQAEAAAARNGSTVAADGDRWRRVVPSPEPRRIIEQDTIRTLVDRDVIVVCGGGGGAPVTEDRTGRLTGAAAVVDKDLTAALLALALAADRLLVLTDAPAIIRRYGTPQAEPIRTISVDDLATMPLPAGSMGPKADACMRFTRASGHPAAIGRLTDAADILAGHTGTTITPNRTADPSGAEPR